jgi:hypothetical protein
MGLRKCFAMLVGMGCSGSSALVSQQTGFTEIWIVSKFLDFFCQPLFWCEFRTRQMVQHKRPETREKASEDRIINRLDVIMTLGK